MFERKGQIIVEKEKAGEDQLMNLVLEAGAEDMRDDGEDWEVISSPESHEAVLEAIKKAGIATVSEEIGMIPKNPDEAGRQERFGHASVERGTGRARRRPKRILELRRRRK